MASFSTSKTRICSKWDEGMHDAGRSKCLYMCNCLETLAIDTVTLLLLLQSALVFRSCLIWSRLHHYAGYKINIWEQNHSENIIHTFQFSLYGSSFLNDLFILHFSVLDCCSFFFFRFLRILNNTHLSISVPLRPWTWQWLGFWRLKFTLQR